MRYYIYTLLFMSMLVFLTGCAGVPSPQEAAVPQEIVAETIGAVSQVSKVSQVSSVTNNQMDTKTLIIIIFLAGWALPSFSSMFGGLFGGIWKVLKLIFLRKL